MEESLSITPKIKGSEIVSLEVEDVRLPLKKSLPLDDLPNLIEATKVFFSYVDIGKLSESIAEVEEEEELPEWEDKDLREFAIKSLRDSQAIALEVLVEFSELDREAFIEEMKERLDNPEYRGWDLGGQLAGITMKSRSWGYEKPFEKEWRTVRDKWKCFYSLRREKYRDVLRDALKERK